MAFSRRNLPNMGQLQTFECAARHQSITLAGDELGLTQSAVSRQIQDLEGQLGIKLFNRARRRIELSVAGYNFLPHAQALLRQAEDLVIRTVTADNATSILNIAVLPTFSSRWLIPRLSSFVALHPGLSLNVYSKEGPFDLNENSLDAAIHYGEPQWPKATCRHLFNETVLPVASPTLLRHPKMEGLTRADLMARAPLLHLSTRPRDWTVWLGQALTKEPLGVGHSFDHISSLIGAAVAGLGVALAPQYLLENELSNGELAILSDRQLPTRKSYHLVVPNDGPDNALIESFYTWITMQISLETRWNTC